MPIGPALPPHLRQTAPVSDSDDDDDIGPALPPHLKNVRFI